MTETASRTQAAQQPLVVFDGDCAFCTASVGFIRERIGPDVEFAPWQRLDLAALGLTEQQVETAVQWIDGDKGRASGARACALLLRRAAQPWRAVGTIMLIPPVSWFAAALYPPRRQESAAPTRRHPGLRLPSPKQD